MMNDHVPADDKEHSVLKRIGKIMVSALFVGLVLAFGFWLLVISNMGPAYLPNVCNGCLDMWIRMTSLVMGLSLWILTAVWSVWHIVRYSYQLIKRSF